MPKKIIVQEIWIFNTRAHIDWAGRCVTPERRCAGSKIIPHLSYFGLQMLQKGKNLQHCLLCRGFVIFMEIPIMSQLKGFICTTKKFLRFAECLLSEEQTGGVCMWGWRPCLFFFPWFMHHPQRSQRSFKYCLSSYTRLTFSSESVSDSVEGFKIRGKFMAIGSFVLISSASNNLSSNLKLVPGMQQAVLRLLLKKGKRKSLLFLKMYAFLSTLHYMLLQDIKITLCFPHVHTSLCPYKDTEFCFSGLVASEERRPVQTSTDEYGRVEPWCIWQDFSGSC